MRWNKDPKRIAEAIKKLPQEERLAIAKAAMDGDTTPQWKLNKRKRELEKYHANKGPVMDLEGKRALAASARAAKLAKEKA